MSIALVTGAAHGIGLEVARQLAGTGVRVVIAGREAGHAAEAAADIVGVEALPVGLDVADPVSVERAVQEITELDILINNAAAHPVRGETPTGADLAAVDAALGVTLFGTWRLTNALLPLLRTSSHPRIVNVSSGAGSHGDERYGIALSGGTEVGHRVGKAALNAYTAALAAELADTPVVVNAVCPGFTATRPGLEDHGARPVADGAAGVVWAATLPDDGPRGGFFRDGRPLAW